MLKIYIRKKEELDELKTYLPKYEEKLHERIKSRESDKNDEKYKERLRKSYKNHPEYIQNLLEDQKKLKEEDKKMWKTFRNLGNILQEKKKKFLMFKI